MAEPSSASYPASAPNLSANRVNQKNFTVLGSHSNSVTTITTSATISGITAPCYLLNGTSGELIYAEGISGATFTSCTRGAGGTSADTMASGDILYAVLVANDINQIIREILAIATEVDTKEDAVTWGDGLTITTGDVASIDFDTSLGLKMSTGGKLQVSLQTTAGLGVSSGALGVVDSDIDHDALTNFVAGEHVPVIDEDTMATNSTGYVPTQQSVKAYIDTLIAGYEPDVTWGDGLANSSGTASVDFDTSAGLKMSTGGKLQVSIQATAGLGFSSGALGVADSDIDHDALTNFSTGEHFTQANITTVGTVTSGNVDAVVSAATSTGAGKVELATTAETNTGTDAARAVTPDGLAGSVFGTKRVVLKVFADTDALSTGDGKLYFTVTPEINGMNLVDADACVYTPTTSSGSLPLVQIYNATDSQDMLSTRITIDNGEYSSYTAATAPVINTSYDDVVTGDRLRVDVDGGGSAATRGLEVHMGFRLP